MSTLAVTVLSLLHTVMPNFPVGDLVLHMWHSRITTGNEILMCENIPLS